MEQSRLRLQLRDLERAAQIALARDASFLEALQALKRMVDNDVRVRAAKQTLRDRGLRVYSSFVPRVRVFVDVGETVTALPSDSSPVEPAAEQGQDGLDSLTSDARTQELRDTASEVIAASLHFRQLQRIVNEAVQASKAFERLASLVERAGYELQICLDLSTYAQVHEATPAAADQPPRAGILPAKAASSIEPLRLSLSRLDTDFLKQLRIRTD